VGAHPVSIKSTPSFGDAHPMGTTNISIDAYIEHADERHCEEEGGFDR